MATPLLLLLLLLAAALLTTTALAAVCPKCGTWEVPYPLSTGPNCGDVNYNIVCHKNSTLYFPSANNTYPITNISAQTQRLIITPSHLKPNTCVTADYTKNGLQLNDSVPFNITGSNTIFYLNCNKTIFGSPLDCSPESLCHVYANATGGASACRDKICCSMTAGSSTTAYRIRLRPDGCKAYMSFVNLGLNTKKPVSKWPKPSVELEWIPPAAAAPEPTYGGTT